MMIVRPAAREKMTMLLLVLFVLIFGKMLKMDPLAPNPNRAHTDNHKSEMINCDTENKRVRLISKVRVAAERKKIHISHDGCSSFSLSQFSLHVHLLK